MIKMFSPLCLMVENGKFADLQLGDTKFGICDCGLKKQLRILKTVAWSPLQIYPGAWGKLSYGKNLKLKISWNCPFKLSFACTKLYRVKTADIRCHTLPTGNYMYIP